MAFSFSGRLDRLDWVFYWGDVTVDAAAAAALRPFRAGVSRTAGQLGAQRRRPDAPAALLYLPGLLLGAGRVATMVRSGRARRHAQRRDRADRAARAGLPGGRARGRARASWCVALRRVRSVTARRQLRWIVGGTTLGALPFVFGYALPWALGFHPLRGFELTAAAARAGAARLRVGHRALSPHGRRGDHQARARVFGGRRRDRGHLRACCCRWRRGMFLGGRRQQDRRHRAARDDGRGAPVASGEERDSDRARSRLLPGPLRLSPRARRLRARPEQRPGPLPAERTARPPRHRNAGRRSDGAAAGADLRRPRGREFVTIAHVGLLRPRRRRCRGCRTSRPGSSPATR